MITRWWHRSGAPFATAGKEQHVIGGDTRREREREKERDEREREEGSRGC